MLTRGGCIYEKENGVTYCLNPGRFFFLGRRSQKPKRGARGQMCPGGARGAAVKASSASSPSGPAFRRLPRSQFSKISLISPPAALNPNTATNQVHVSEIGTHPEGTFTIKHPILFGKPVEKKESEEIYAYSGYSGYTNATQTLFRDFIFYKKRPHNSVTDLVFLFTVPDARNWFVKLT